MSTPPFSLNDSEKGERVLADQGNKRGVTPIKLNVALPPERTALLIIDLTKAYLPDSPLLRALGQLDGADPSEFNRRMNEQVLPTVRELRAVFHERGLPVILTREGSEYPDMRDVPRISREFLRELEEATGEPVGQVLTSGHPDYGLMDELKPVENEYVVDKPGFSVFSAPKFRELLADLGVETLVLCGVTTSCCVESTARSGADAGFDVVAVEPGVADFDPDAHDASMRAIKLNFGTVASSAAEVREALDGARAM